MGYLIIIRGSTGIGKTTVSKALIERLGKNKTHHLKLDQILVQEFEEDMQKALQHEHVVGEMYYGNSHTTDPQEWINRFKNRGYKILSVILQASFDTCFIRVNNRLDHNFPRKEDYIHLYNMFQSIQQTNIFARKAEVREIVIDTEHKSISKIVDEMLSYLGIN